MTMTPSLNIGVEYKISTVDLGVIHPSTLKNEGVAFIRLQWVDFTNSIKYRIMPLPYFQKLLASHRPGPAIPKAVLGLVHLSMAEGFSGMGEYIYALDLKTLRHCPYEPGHASLMGWFEEKAPVQLPDGSSSVAVALCPRTTLKRVVDLAEKESQVKFLVGFESEFILLKNTNPIEYASVHQFASPSAMRPGDVVTKVMNEIAKNIQAAGIELQLYHAEAAPGQYEVATGPLPPLESADALIHTREIIYNTAALHGLRATFAPRLTMSSTGSATHAHISVHSTYPTGMSTPSSSSSNNNNNNNNTSTNADGTTTTHSHLTPLEQSFLSGILTHLPSLPALTLPTSPSYTRMHDGIWSGGTYVCWGTENRESPIRLTNPRSETSRRFEMRFIDGTANPYLVLAGILGAGVGSDGIRGLREGIRGKGRLDVKDNPGPKSAAQMTEEERREFGIVRRMPLSWEEARRNIVADEEVVEILGKELVEGYLSVNKLLDETLRRQEGSKNGVSWCESEGSVLDRLVRFY